MSSFVVNDKSFADFTTAGGVSFSRAGAGYALDNSGLLTQFAAGAYRRTNRGVLIEQAATRLNTVPNGWSGSGSPATVASASPIAAPDGAMTAIRLSNIQAALGDRNGGVSASGLTPSTAYSGSLWVRGTVGEKLTFTFKRTSGTLAILSIQVTLTGIWQLIQLPNLVLASDNTAAALFVTKTSTDTADVVDLWGGQIEAGAICTSIVPGTGSTAARPKDALREVGAAISTPWTICGEAEFLGDTGGTQVIIDVTAAGSGNNRIVIFRNSAGTLFFNGFSGGSSVLNRSVAKTGARTIKSAVSFDGLTYLCAVDSAGLSSTTGAAPAAQLDQIDLGQSNTSASLLNGYLRKARVLPYALGQTDLNALTA